MNKRAYRVLTEFPVALDSPDHLRPGGAMHDNSTNPAFDRLLESLPQLAHRRPLRVMDLGCSGGGFVRGLLDAGHDAVGLEGSDYSSKWDGPGGTEAERAARREGKRAEWATIPERLFTCDISRPFEVVFETDLWREDLPTPVYEDAHFDLVTAWEVMEHLTEPGLKTLCDNVRRHLAPWGLWLMSVSSQSGPHHQTVKPPHWWRSFFERQGFENLPGVVSHFGDEWIRGPKQNAPESFHLALRIY